MRLIDADKFIYHIARIDDLRKLSTKTIGQALRKCETVEAIPIEWIKQYKYYNGLFAMLIEDWRKENEKG